MRLRHSRNIYLVIAALTGPVFFSACSKSGNLASHLERADELFQADDFAAAELEYLNVLRLDQTSQEAISRLGIIYYDQVRLRKAFPYLAQAAQSDPTNFEVLYRLGSMQLLSGDPAAAREQALGILKADPGNTHAPILLANASTSGELVADSRNRLQSLSSQSPNNSSIDAALAIIEARGGNPDQAETLIEAALEKDSENQYAYLVLRSLRANGGDQAGALQALEKATEYSPLRSSNRVELAQRHLSKGNLEEYKALIDPLLRDTPKFVPAQLIAARYQAQQNKPELARRHLDNLLNLDPVNHDGLILSGNLYLAAREIEKALETMEKLAELYPNSPFAQFHLARAQLADDEVANAKNALLKCLSINPEFWVALRLMTQLQTQTGEYYAAETNLTKLLERDPENLSLNLQLAAVKRGQGNNEEALAIYQMMEAVHADNAQLPLLRAQLFAQQNDSGQAKAAVEDSLERDPNFALALDLLVSFLISERRYDYALEQVQERIQRQPESASFTLIEAKVHISQHAWDRAEQSLLKAIELDPEQRTPYMLLSQVYVQDDKRSAALKRLQEVVSKNPEDIPALMIMCGIYEYEKEFENARYTYEKILEVNSNFPPALNNLAYLYSEYFDNQDEAYEYANRARQLLSHDPAIADTLGWILFKRGDYQWAQTLIQESTEKLNDNAEVRYHLGMTHYMLGNADQAREAFEFALSKEADFNGKDDLEARMEILQIRDDPTASTNIAALESRSKKLSSDPVLLEMLANAYAIKGEADNAIKTYEAVLEINPENAEAMRQKAILFREKGDFEKGFELAKEAYKLKPNDPSVSLALGQFAFEAGDHPWSASLLQASASRRSGDTETQYHLAKSLVALGRINEALAAFGRILAAEHSQESKALAGLLKAIETAGDKNLNTDGLDFELAEAWAQAFENNRMGDSDAAVAEYQQILRTYPNFNVAKREITLIQTKAGNHSEDILKLAREAARAYPDNEELKAAIEILENS